MKYISIDIETTGLDPETCQVIEFAAILEDTEKSNEYEYCPRFHRYVLSRNQEYYGQIFAINMNKNIFEKLANRDQDYRYCLSDHLINEFSEWLSSNNIQKVITAGKNFSGFDKKFLDKLGFSSNIKMHHRVIDPMPMYLKSSDSEPPNLTECLKRAGLEPTDLHTALGDAWDVIRLIRNKI